MGITDRLRAWPVYRQLTGSDPLGRGSAARSPKPPIKLEGATDVRSVCPYCAVGCGQRVFVEDGKVTQIEGDPDSPISRGRLCPKGSASKSLVTSPLRQTTVLFEGGVASTRDPRYVVEPQRTTSVTPSRDSSSSPITG